MSDYEAADHLATPKGFHVLVVEDDPSVQRTIVNYFGEHQIRVTAASDQQAMMQALRMREPDVVILDLQLGPEDGLDLLRQLRAKSVVPIILITGNRREESDRVIGLELGADDYVTKPFSLRELLARVRAVLRRRSMDLLSPSHKIGKCYEFGKWRFDQRARTLTSPVGEVVALTKGEFALLSALVAAPRRPLTREQLLQATRVHEDVFDRSIDVQILRLRRKLEQAPTDPRMIKTVRGIGYVLDTDVAIL